MAVRQWHISQALASVASLNKILLELTAEEVIRCLDLESQSTRRKSVIDRLMSRSVRLNELQYASQLQHKYSAIRA